MEIAIGGTVLPIAFASLAAYAFAWLDFPGSDWLFIGVIAMLVVPLQMALIPIFSLYNHLSLFDTIWGLILFHTAFGMPFAIFLLRNFFIGIPKDILESARIDGCSEIRIFLRLILPLGLPAIASLAIFQFLWTWNDLLVALTMARNTQPMTVAIFSNLRQFGSNIELIAPAAFFSLTIPLIVFLAFQRYFVQGLLAGSVEMRPEEAATEAAASPGHWFQADPLWFKRAVFYEIHIRGFYDGNGDGSGDLRGLTEKLEYLKWLGIDCLWLLPMYPSPLRDGGYDIADFLAIHPDYGAVEDFRRFVDSGAPARHARDRRLRHESHLERSPVVPGVARQPGFAQARLVRVVGHRQALRGRAHHLH